MNIEEVPYRYVIQLLDISFWLLFDSTALRFYISQNLFKVCWPIRTLNLVLSLCRKLLWLKTTIATRMVLNSTTNKTNKTISNFQN